MTTTGEPPALTVGQIAQIERLEPRGENKELKGLCCFAVTNWECWSQMRGWQKTIKVIKEGRYRGGLTGWVEERDRRSLQPVSQITLITAFSSASDSGWHVSQFLEQRSDLKNQQSGNCFWRRDTLYSLQTIHKMQKMNGFYHLQMDKFLEKWLRQNIFHIWSNSSILDKFHKGNKACSWSTSVTMASFLPKGKLS